MYHILVDYMDKAYEDHVKYVKRADPIHAVTYLKALIDVGLPEKAQQLIRELNIRLVEGGFGKENVIGLVEVLSTFSEMKELEDLNKRLMEVIGNYVKE